MELDAILDVWEDLAESGQRMPIAEFLDLHFADLSPTDRAVLVRRATAIDSMNRVIAGPSISPMVREQQNSEGRLPEGELRIEAGAEAVPGYHLLSRLGGGGFGEVWKAAGPGGFQVALKFVRLDRPGATADYELRALEIAKRIRHPNILSTFGAWQRDGWLVIATELAGESLFDRLQTLKEQGRTGIPEKELLSYMADAAKAIDYLNKRQHPDLDGGRSPIQHRDIKPQNLLLSGGGVKVADFGIAKHMPRSLTGHTGAVTTAYAPPEAFDNQTSDSFDQYSLAVTYCVLRGGQLPFAGTDLEIVRGHIDGKPDLSMLPTGERPIVNRALSKNPQDRWPSCTAFVSAIQDIATVAPAKPDRRDATRMTAGDQRRSWRTARTILWALAMPLTIGAVWFARNPPWQKSPVNTAPQHLAEKTTGVAAQRSSAKTASQRSVPVIAVKPTRPQSRPPKISELRRLIGHTADIRRIAIGANGTVAASSDVRSRVFLWDLEGTPRRRELAGHKTDVKSIAFSPDSRMVATGTYNHQLRLWNVKSASLIHRMTVDFTIESAVFSTNGSLVIGGRHNPRPGQTEIGRIQIWNVRTFRKIQETTTRSPVHAICVSSDQRYVIAGEWDGTVEAWQPQSGEKHGIAKHSAAVLSVGVSPDNQYVVSTSENSELRLSELQSGRLQFRRSIPGGFGLAAFLATRNHTCLIWTGPAMVLLDATTGNPTLLKTLGNSLPLLAVSQDGRRLLVGGRGGDLRVLRID